MRAFEQWKIGRKGVDDGVLLVVAKDDRRVRIEVGYGLEGAIPDATSARVIQEYLVPKFRAGDYAGGITDASGALVKLIDGEPLPRADGRAPRRAPRRRWQRLAVGAVRGLHRRAGRARHLRPRAVAAARPASAARAAGGIAWLISSMLLVGGIGAAIGFFMGLASAAERAATRATAAVAAGAAAGVAAVSVAVAVAASAAVAAGAAAVA